MNRYESFEEDFNLFKTFRTEFFKRLKSKTNWGYNQIEKLYSEVIIDVLGQELSNKTRGRFQ